MVKCCEAAIVVLFAAYSLPTVVRLPFYSLPIVVRLQLSFYSLPIPMLFSLRAIIYNAREMQEAIAALNANEDFCAVSQAVKGTITRCLS